MDNTKYVRRGASRQKLVVSDFNGIGEDLSSTEKSKKLRRLSSVNSAGNLSNEECKMGSCDSSDRENQCPSRSQSNVSTKGFKVPKTFFYDLNAVDHTSVPRKLRSAMKKRNHKSISPPLPDSKKWNHTLGEVESHKKDEEKKPKLNSKQGIPDWSQKPTVSGPITKDEEEVVQTLFELAGMFRDDDKDGACLDAIASVPTEVLASPALAIEEGVDSNSRPQAAGEVPPPNADNSTRESAKVISSNRTASPERTEFFESKLKHMGLDSSVPPVSSNENMLPSNNSVHNDEKPCPGAIPILPELSLESGLKQSEQQVTPLERIHGISPAVIAIESQIAVQHMIKEPGKNGLTLWPGLFSAATGSAGSHSPSWSAADKMPAWVDVAMFSSRPSSSENCLSKMVSEVTVAKKAMKRSVAHVNISHLTRALKKQEVKVNWSLQSVQLNGPEEFKEGVLLPLDNSNGMKNDVNSPIATSKSETFSASGNPLVDRNTIFPQHKMLHQDQPHFPPASRMHSPKHSFDFLSLSAGGTSLEANAAGKGFGSSAQLQFPYLQLPPEQSIIPFSIQQTHYSPRTYMNHISATPSQVQVQLPQYLNSPPSASLNASHLGILKQEQRLWAVQLSAQYRGVRTSTASNQFLSWQQGKQESPTLMLNASTILPPSSLHWTVPKNGAVPQLQQPLMAGPSLPAERMKIQEHHLTHLYEASSNGFRPSGALPLQLLCNEQL